jgi:uncharacterized protein YnzC (UPF0291/DUF896 family)
MPESGIESTIGSLRVHYERLSGRINALLEKERGSGLVAEEKTELVALLRELENRLKVLRDELEKHAKISIVG